MPRKNVIIWEILAVCGWCLVGHWLPAQELSGPSDTVSTRRMIANSRVVPAQAEQILQPQAINPSGVADQAERVGDPSNRTTDERTESSATSSVSRNRLEVASLIGPLQPTSELFGKMQLESEFDRSLASGYASPDIAECPSNTFCWTAPNLYHQPLYFEQPYMERFGVGPHRAVQPWSSGLAFYGRIPLLPLSLLNHPPQSRDYTLGYRRPGDSVTRVPLRTKYSALIR